ncbi:FNBP1 [Mytilus coruscus]|uniref:FNBP1 n=1 Tax=Mytilus coruscus TaxID=42192 RepID=A0A6J8CGR2_MYTCO|nr:FNBP1 [Mytilus coruscus]
MSNTSDTPPSYTCKDFEDIAKCFEKLHLHINNEVEILKTKQTETERRVDLIENHNEFMNSELHAIHNTHIPNLESLIEKEQTERLKLEIWGRKWNVVIRGVQGTPNHRELPKATEAFTRAFLKNTLNIPPERADNMLFTAVHRLPSGGEDRRSIMLRLSSLIDRDDILKAAIKLPPRSGYSVVPDLPPSLSVRRGELLKERRDLSPESRRKTKLVYLRDAPFLKLVTKRS